MRYAAPLLFLLLPTCSLVIDGRTEPYEGACADEEEAVSATYGPGDSARTLTEILRECLPCSEEDCVERCLVQATGGAVSHECAACYADLQDCTERFCRPVCLGVGDDPTRCERCACDNGCVAEFDACSGLPVTLCE